jgi:hypothetical protein
MSLWLTSLLLAIMFATIPFTFIASLLARMPPPLASSYGRWPAMVNSLLVGAITMAVTVFVHSAYFSGPVVSAAFAVKCVLALLIYGLGFTLLLRQVAGVYPEYIVTLGWAGLGLRKTSYGNILRIDVLSAGEAETRFRIDTARGASIQFTLPTADVMVFQEQIRRWREQEEGEA